MMESGILWDGWKVEGLIGEGAFGKVYKIVREQYGFTYESALKVIKIPQSEAELAVARHDGMSEKSITAYFQSMVEDIVVELSLMSKLRGHSNIVSFEDYKVIKLEDSFGWEIHIRMELLIPLFEYIESRELNRQDIIRMGIDICHALEVCQKYKIIHRDIKPENIFLSKQGQFKLGDFGISRQLERTTAGLSKKGTVSYMAPEVYQGKAYNSTVDIYALGIVLYRFLNNNRTPFLPPFPQQLYYSDRENANQRRMNGEPLPPPLNADDQLAEIVLKACAYDPEVRYQDALSLRHDLEELLTEEERSAIESSLEISPVKVEPIMESTEVLNGDKTHYIFGQKPEEQDYHVEQIESEVIEPEITDTQFRESTDLTSIDSEPEEGFDFIPEPEVINPSISDQKTEEDATALILPENDEYNLDENNQAEIGTIVDVLDLDTISPESESEESSDIVGESLSEVSNQSDDHKEPEKKIVVNRKKFLLIPVIICILVVLCIGVNLYRYYHYSVPALVGMNKENAEIVVKDAGLKYKYQKQFSDTIEKNVVISQKPKQGATVKKGTSVVIVLSRGKGIPVPNIIGKEFKKVKPDIESRGLAIKEVKAKQRHNSIKKGCVTAQTPKEGTLLEMGTPVTAEVSIGLVKVKVPDVEGKKKKKAVSKLKKAGLKPIVEKVPSSTVTKGHVIYQSIKPNKKVEKNSKVTIYVSTGTPVSQSASGTYSDNRTGSGSGSSSSGGKSSNSSKSNKSGGSSGSGSSHGPELTPDG